MESYAFSIIRRALKNGVAMVALCAALVDGSLCVAADATAGAPATHVPQSSVASAAAVAQTRAEILKHFQAVQLNDSDAARAEIAYIRSISKPNQVLVNNLADDKQLHFLLRNLKKAGRTPLNAPQLFTSVATMRAIHTHLSPASVVAAATRRALVGDTADDRITLNTIVALGQVDSAPPTVNKANSASIALADTVPAYSAGGLSSVPGGTQATLAIIQLFDAGTNTPFGPGANNQQFGGGVDLTVTQTSTPAAPVADVGAFLQVTYQETPTTDPVTITYQTSVAGMPTAPPTVTAPVHVYQNPPNTNIKVCLSRDTVPDSTCDYGPFQAPSANPLVQLPVSGQISFNSAVDTTRTIAGTLIVWAKNGGGACTLNLNPTQFAQAFTVNGAAPNTLDWQFFYMVGSTRYNQAPFGVLNNNPCWTPDQPYGMTLDVNVPIVGTLLPQEFFVTTTPGPSIGNATRISSLNFTWGCFAAGTQVLMASGEIKAIEDIKIGDVVIADGSGRHLIVRETTKGTEASPMVNITDALGHTLSVTDGHAVVIDNGKGHPTVVLAKQLKEGDVLYTSDLALAADKKPRNFVKSKIAKIERAKYDGYVYNVYLGRQDKGDIFGKSDTTLIANGIVTGDNAMQEYFGADFNFKPANVKQRIDPKWHQDYDNFLKMQRMQK